MPIKDNLPHARFPLVTLALAAANVLAHALPPAGLPLAPMLLDLALLVLFGASLERALGHTRLLAASLLGAALALALRSLLGDASADALAYAAGGATVAVLAGYLTLFPRARVVSLVLVPFLVTIVEVPAVLLLGLWAAAQIYLGVA